MPTVINERGFQFRIYTRDHPPAHVHVWHQGYEAIIEFRDEIVIRDGDRRFSRRDIARMIEIIEVNRQYLIEEWRKIHEQV